MSGIIHKELKKLKAAKDLAEQKYHLITNTTIDAIIMITPEGKISFWNPAAEKIFGYKKQEILGTTGSNRKRRQKPAKSRG